MYVWSYVPNPVSGLPGRSNSLNLSTDDVFTMANLRKEDLAPGTVAMASAYLDAAVRFVERKLERSLTGGVVYMSLFENDGDMLFAPMARAVAPRAWSVNGGRKTPRKIITDGEYLYFTDRFSVNTLDWGICDESLFQPALFPVDLLVQYTAEPFGNESALRIAVLRYAADLLESSGSAGFAGDGALAPFRRVALMAA
jgi:hypothetical protein